MIKIVITLHDEEDVHEIGHMIDEAQRYGVHALEQILRIYVEDDE